RSCREDRLFGCFRVAVLEKQLDVKDGGCEADVWIAGVLGEAGREALGLFHGRSRPQSQHQDVDETDPIEQLSRKREVSRLVSKRGPPAALAVEAQRRRQPGERS